MAIEVKLPQLGQTMEEGTVVGCLVKVGDEVKKGDVIFEVETDKATLEVESPAEGFVKHIIAQVGKTLPVGDLMLILGEKDEVIAAIPSKTTSSPPKAQSTQTTVTNPPKAQETFQLPDSATIVRLPQLGQTMEEGTVVNCLIKIGDHVKKGDVIFEIETDKATLEMESPAEGFVKHILAETGQTLPVGEPVIILGPKNQDVPEGTADYVKGSHQPAPVRATQAGLIPPAREHTTKEHITQKPERIIATPKAKKLAKELCVDLSKITGSGPAGKITEEDIKQQTQGKTAATAPTTQATLGRMIPISKIQKITAEKMLKSKLQIPCFYLTVRVDVTDLVKFRTTLNKTTDIKVAYNDFIIRAVALGLEKFPIMTGQFAGDSIKLAENINVGLAISVTDGLIAPIVKDANKKDIKQIARDTTGLIEKARNNKLLLTDLEGGCITISNLGAFGIHSFAPIVVPGQCSILGVGQISDCCIPEVATEHKTQPQITVRKLMNITLSVDHKVANGAYAAQFLDFVRKTLQDTSNFG